MELMNVAITQCREYTKSKIISAHPRKCLILEELECNYAWVAPVRNLKNMVLPDKMQYETTNQVTKVSLKTQNCHTVVLTSYIVTWHRCAAVSSKSPYLISTSCTDQPCLDMPTDGPWISLFSLPHLHPHSYSANTQVPQWTCSFTQSFLWRKRPIMSNSSKCLHRVAYCCRFLCFSCACEEAVSRNLDFFFQDFLWWV